MSKEVFLAIEIADLGADASESNPSPIQKRHEFEEPSVE
jgi:hypothetical protein